MKTKAIIFDKDGTLLDFDSFWVTISHFAIEDILKAVGKENISVEDILSAIGVNNQTADINGVLCRGTYAQIAQEIYNILINCDCDCTIDEITQQTIAAYHRNFEKGVVKPTCENIAEVLSNLKNSGIKLAVVTTDDPYVTQKCLQSLKIDNFFDTVYTDDGKLPVKPDPYCIYDFCEKNNISKSEVVMVGDTLTDAGFAKNGGIRFIGVAKTETNKKVLEKETNTVVQDISCLFEVLD